MIQILTHITIIGYVTILFIILPLRLAKSPNYLTPQRLLISLFQMEIAELVISWLCF